jgi:hypothetical protein
VTPVVEHSGLNAAFGQRVHCIAAEPKDTILRLGVIDAGQEVAYEAVMLGTLRRGYRIFQLRGLLGPRIELSHLFVRITFGRVPNTFPTPRLVRARPARRMSSSRACRTRDALSGVRSYPQHTAPHCGVGLRSCAKHISPRQSSSTSLQSSSSLLTS